MECGRKIETRLGGTETFTLECKLKKNHTGGHRTPLQGEIPDMIFIVTWFRENGGR